MLTTLLLLSGMAEATTPLAPPKPTAEQRALYDALKVRDGGPSCEALAALSQDIATDLIWIIDHMIHAGAGALHTPSGIGCVVLPDVLGPR